MAKHSEARKMALEALQMKLPESLFSEPLDYIFADHFRQRTLCGLLDEVAEAKYLDDEVITATLRFLKCEFGPHVLDEEEDLFPLLRHKAEADDDITEVLGQLSQEHASDKVDANAIIDQLSSLLDYGHLHNLTSEGIELIKRFAANERQHLILENAIVLPLARARLTDQDFRELGKRMAARRGIALPSLVQ